MSNASVGEGVTIHLQGAGGITDFVSLDETWNIISGTDPHGAVVGSSDDPQGWNLSVQDYDYNGAGSFKVVVTVTVPCDAATGTYSWGWLRPSEFVSPFVASDTAVAPPYFDVIPNPDPTKTTIDGIGACP